MALIFNEFYKDLIALIITISIGILTYFKWAFNYWKKLNVPYIEPSIPFGTLKNPLWKPESFTDNISRNYNTAKSNGHKHVGLYGTVTPIYMPVDPELIKNIMVTDFQHFVDRGMYYNERDDPLSAHLFTLEGTKWRNLRMKLTPTFTSGKLKMMFETLVECGVKLKEAMDDVCEKNVPVDIKDMLARFTTDIIGSCAFGLDCNTFKDPNSEFRRHGKRVFLASKSEAFKGLIAFAVPWLARMLRLVITPREPADFFMKIIQETVEYREKNNVTRKDFMQLLLELKNDPKNREDGKGLTLNELAAQAFVFFIAGYETSSTTMTFCLFELSVNPEIQERVREEINTVLEAHDGKIAYDAMMEMKYMEQVIDETLRKYPPLPVYNRKCVKDYKVPNTDLVLKEGTAVFIPVVGIQRDPDYYPDPEKFDPDRFSAENKKERGQCIYMPFGEGPRVCIGLRFGMMQTKVGLTVLLNNYRFSLNEKTKTPLEMDPYSFILSTLGDMWLNVEKI